MDRERLRQQLDLAMENVKRGARLIAEHQKLIMSLEREGRDISQASDLLTMLEDTQAMNVMRRDRLLVELMEGPKDDG